MFIPGEEDTDDHSATDASSVASVVKTKNGADSSTSVFSRHNQSITDDLVRVRVVLVHKHYEAGSFKFKKLLFKH